MTRLPPAPLALAAAALVSALSLGACGGGDGGGDGGDTLTLGQEAVVEYTTPASGDTPAVNTTLGVTALAVREGTQQELEAGGLQVDEEDKDTTPYYVDARFANKGDGELTRNLSVSMEDSDGNSLPTTLVIGLGGEPFEKCENINQGTLAPGQSYEACTLFLVPEGTDVGKVLFTSQGADAQITFTYWETE